MKLTGAIVLLFAAASAAAAELSPLVLADETEPVSGTRHAQVLFDESRSLTVAEVRGGEAASRFREPRRDDLNFGLQTAAIWLRFRVAAEATGRWWGVVHKPRLQKIDIYVVQGDDVAHFASGMDRPFEQRAVLVREHVFPVSLREGEEATVFIRTESRASQQLPVRFWTAKTYLARTSAVELGEGVYFAYQLALVLTAFIFAGVMRERMSALLGTAILMNVLTDYCAEGYAEWIGIPAKALLSFHAVPAVAHMALVFGMVYVGDLCDVRTRWPRLARVYRGYVLFEFVFAFALLVHPGQSMISAHLVLISLTAVVITAISLGTVLQRYRPAYFFFGGWAFFLALVFTRSVAHLGFLPTASLNVISFQGACMVGTTLFMVAIADRARTIRGERDETRRRLFEQTRTQAKTLQRKVRERTAELEEAKERAERANREKTRFIADVSHDLRAPVSSFVALSNVLRHHGKKLELPDAFGRFLSQLHAAGQFLVLMLNNILDISAIEMNAHTVRSEVIYLADWQQRVSNLAMPLAEAGGARLFFAEVPASTHFESDPTRLGQVLLNLIQNAVNFSPPDALVSVALSLQSEELVMEVADEGPGIPEDDKERVFEMFERGGGEGNNGDGIGLGLSIVKRNVELLKGTVQAVDAEPSGARFVVRIPVAGRPGPNVHES